MRALDDVAKTDTVSWVSRSEPETSRTVVWVATYLFTFMIGYISGKEKDLLLIMSKHFLRSVVQSVFFLKIYSN